MSYTLKTDVLLIFSGMDIWSNNSFNLQTPSIQRLYARLESAGLFPGSQGNEVTHLRKGGCFGVGSIVFDCGLIMSIEFIRFRSGLALSCLFCVLTAIRVYALHTKDCAALWIES